MSAVSLSTADEILRRLIVDPELARAASKSSSITAASDSRSIEALIRLIVHDELRRYPPAMSVDDTSVPTAGRGDAAAQEPMRNASPGHAADDESDAQVMSADDVAAFLGVDRNTVYDYAGRGTIPCRRLGKRLLFHKPTLVSWLAPCKAASTRKA
jgi:excisionase family DNA binding protein